VTLAGSMPKTARGSRRCRLLKVNYGTITALRLHPSCISAVRNLLEPYHKEQAWGSNAVSCCIFSRTDENCYP